MPSAALSGKRIALAPMAGQSTRKQTITVSRRAASLPQWFLFGCVVSSGTVDAFASVVPGSISIQAVMSVFIAAGASLLAVLHWRQTPEIVGCGGRLLLYLLWVTLSLFWTARISVVTVQNMVLDVLFVAVILAVANEVYASPSLACSLAKALVLATGIASILYAGSLAAYGLGASSPIGARSFALFALVGVCWALAGWRMGANRSLLAAIAIAALIAGSLSRTALAAAVLLFPWGRSQKQNRKLGWLTSLVLCVAMLACLAGATLVVEPLRERFWEGDQQLIGTYGRMNTSGRGTMWEVVTDSWRQSPWIGKGPGSAGMLVESMVPGLAHPHNDYLRILHDHGIIGLLLWLFGVFSLWCNALREWLATRSSYKFTAQVHLASSFAIIALVLAMSTDNPIVYVFVVVPVSTLIGMSLGLSSRRSQLSRLSVRRRVR